MTTGTILVLAAVLFPVAVRVTVSVFNRIGNNTSAVTRPQGSSHSAKL